MSKGAAKINSSSSSSSSTSTGASPNTAPKKRSTLKKLFKFFFILSSLVFIFYGCLIVAVMLVPSVQSVFVYLHLLHLPFNVQYDTPHVYGLHGTRNLNITTLDGVKLGVWHVLPAGHETIESERRIANGEDLTSVYTDLLATSKQKVYIYYHGNAGTRAVGHRVELYKVISSHLNGHVITFDYRGFGDSDGWPSEEGLNTDAFSVYNWVLKQINNDASRVVIWGHSLGSGVTSRFISELCTAVNSQGKSPSHVIQTYSLEKLPLPSSLILDAPFSSLQDAALYHPAGRLFQVIPYYEQLLTMFLLEKFPSVERIKNITLPLLILHGRQDFRLPFFLGEALYDSAIAARAVTAKLGTVAPVIGTGYHVVSREAHGVRFVELPEGEHNSIYCQPGLLSSVISFFQDHVH